MQNIFIGWASKLPLQVPQASYDFIQNDNDPSSNSPSHGTSCGGIIGAVKNNVCGLGIAYNVNLGGKKYC